MNTYLKYMLTFVICSCKLISSSKTTYNHMELKMKKLILVTALLLVSTNVLAYDDYDEDDYYYVPRQYAPASSYANPYAPSIPSYSRPREDTRSSVSRQIDEDAALVRAIERHRNIYGR